MQTAWRRFAVFGAAFVVFAGGNVVRAVLNRDQGTASVALDLVGAVLMTTLAALFLRQAVLRRRAERSSRG